MSEVNKQLWDAVELGVEAEAFLKSALGKKLEELAVADIDEAFDEFKSVDPEDAKAVRAIQFKAQVAGTALTWLLEIVESGEQAERVLKDQEGE